MRKFYWSIATGLLAILLVASAMTVFVDVPREQHQQQLQQAAANALMTTYLGQPIPFTDLPAGCYTVECVTDEYLGYAVLRQAIPTGDITRMVREVPSGYCSPGFRLDLRQSRSA